MKRLLLGAHMSIAGGVHLAVERAGAFGFNTMAMFVRNQRQWAAPPLTEAAVKLFQQARKKVPVAPIAAHASYLINLAGAGQFREKSLTAAADELSRCCELGVEYYVLHPGSTGGDDRPAAIARLGEALNSVTAACGGDTMVLLEATAGAGWLLGGTFEELAAMLEPLRPAGRFGICLDSCHLFAAGYDIRTPEGYQDTMARFDRLIGLPRLKVFHVNDSRSGLGSHLDRHAHIGRGKIGLAGFANIVNDPRLSGVPLILETKKELAPDGTDMDLVNARVLLSLAEKKPSPQRTQRARRKGKSE